MKTFVMDDWRVEFLVGAFEIAEEDHYYLFLVNQSVPPHPFLQPLNIL